MGDIRMHIALANSIRRDILSGIYGTQGGLPGIEELVKLTGSTKVTLYKALAVLEGEGLIVSRNRSFYVNKSSITMTEHVPPARMRLQAEGKIAVTKNLVPVAIVPLPDYLKRLLQLEGDITAVFRYRVSGEIRDGKEIPARLIKYHYLVPLTPEQIQRMQDDQYTNILLETHPVKMQRHDDVSSRLPTPEEAKYLGIPESTPVLDLRIINRDMDGNLLLVQELVLLGTTLTYDYIFDNKPKA
jgi:DNA-binding GntR family transcriptional regulator